MLEVNIPGYRTLVLSFLVLDFNGTIACDGHLIPGVRDRLEAQRTVSVGNGRNDALMLREAVLGIAVIQEEGGAVETLLAADIVTHSILDALDLLRHPPRLAATLRS